METDKDGLYEELVYRINHVATMWNKLVHLLGTKPVGRCDPDDGSVTLNERVDAHRRHQAYCTRARSAHDAAARMHVMLLAVMRRGNEYDVLYNVRNILDALDGELSLGPDDGQMVADCQQFPDGRMAVNGISTAVDEAKDAFWIAKEYLLCR